MRDLPVLRLGTRASALATTQSGLVADLVRERLGREVELVEVATEGDRNAAPLASMGGTGVFVSALRDALLEGRVGQAGHKQQVPPHPPPPRPPPAPGPPPGTSWSPATA